MKGVFAGRVKLKCFADDGSGRWIGFLDLSFTSVEIPQRSRQRIEPLLQATVKPLSSFFPQVTDIVGGDHGLNVPRQSAASCVEIQTFIRKVNLNPGVDQLTEIGPVLQISCAAINLVNNHASCRALS